MIEPVKAAHVPRLDHIADAVPFGTRKVTLCQLGSQPSEVYIYILNMEADQLAIVCSSTFSERGGANMLGLAWWDGSQSTPGIGGSRT